MSFRMLFTTEYLGGSFVNTASQIAPTGSSLAGEPIGRVTSISGGQAKITLAAPTGVRASDHHFTVGRFLGVQSGAAVIIGLISAVDEHEGPSDATETRSVARLELIGEIRNVAGVP